MNGRGIQALIRIHRWQLDELRRKAAPLEQQRQDLLDHGLALMAQLETERAAVSEGFGTMADLQTFKDRVMLQHDEITRRVAEIDQTIEQLREQMADAFQDVKKFEITEEQRQESVKRARDHREQSQLDEIGLNNHRRRESSRSGPQ